MSGRQLGGEGSPSFVRLLIVMAVACLAPVVALGLVGSTTDDNDNVTASESSNRPSAPVVEAPSKRATTTAPATTSTTADPVDEDSDDVAAAGPTTTATTPVTEPPTTTVPPTTGPAPPPGTVGVAPSVAEQVVVLVNAERAAAPRPCDPLTVDDRLAAAAQGHSDDMAANDYFSHTSLDGSTYADRAAAAGFTGSKLGENIAAGQRSPEVVMAAWMDSAGHQRNILDCAYTVIGVGLSTHGWYWTQMFGATS
ncbi:MAG: CAP domain-containing protein [Acidimicrobiales bacterium]